MKKLIKIAAVALVIIVAVVAVAIYKIQGPPVETTTTELRFRSIPLPFEHKPNLDESLPFMGMATADIDGDGVDEIVIGGGKDQADSVFRFGEAGFTPIDSVGLEKPAGDATFGITSQDTTGDGLDELFIARESGLYYAENTGGKFSQKKLEFGMAENTTPLSIAAGDINRDGWVDLYISGYIRADLIEGETIFEDGYGGYSYLLLNDGTNQWENISESAGVFRQHNTFLAVFADLNQDQWPDLVVAQDTGKVEIWENAKDNTFKPKPAPTDYSYPMGIGVGDIDNDGDVDLYFSNVGTTLPRKLVQGDLTDDQAFNMDYILLRNDGDFKFTDIAAEVNAAKYGFGWGTTIADFNNDSRMDLYFAQNYIRFPGAKLLALYPGRLLEQQEDGRFISVEKSAGGENGNFGITQVVSDFNQDGSLDLVIGNIEGPAIAFLSEETGANRGLSVRLPSGAQWLNTVGEVMTAEGKTIRRQFVASEGLCSDGFHGLHFGLGKSGGSVSLTLTRPDGGKKTYENVASGQTLTVTE
ncbi:CRTAC1 family protein [Verrucomicrobiales bacterium]|nr:CRTAC1 family protein [Verrucomicrobiales bacterium]